MIRIPCGLPASVPYCPPRTVIGIVVLSALLSACATSSVLAPLGKASPRTNAVATSQGPYRVISGDSLYSISWQYGLDYRDLARWNGIASPYTIYPGQLLQVARPASVPTKPPSPSTRTPAPAPASPPSGAAQRSAKTTVTAPVERKSTVSTTPTPKATVSKDSRANQTSEQTVLNWRWPAKGKVIGGFGQAGGKGIDIEGRRGSPIAATAPGHVVYSGSGLRGYGRLIIVKHNKRYLSAYAHNDRLHVKEGDTVQGGQRIAEMGDSGAKSVRLHFEIRRDGEPVDPTRFLPN